MVILSFLINSCRGTVVQFIGIQHGIASIFWIGVYSSPVVVFAALSFDNAGIWQIYFVSIRRYGF